MIDKPDGHGHKVMDILIACASPNVDRNHGPRKKSNVHLLQKTRKLPKLIQVHNIRISVRNCTMDINQTSLRRGKILLSSFTDSMSSGQ